MKKIFAFLCAAVLAFSCSTPEPGLEVTVTNPIDVNRTEEIIELDFLDVRNQLNMIGEDQVSVYDPNGTEIQHQITYSGKLLFQVDVAPLSSSTYKIMAGGPTPPTEFAPKVFGRQFYERVDDFAWENDRIAFRIYGPALQATGERAYGNDVWVKSVPEMVVEDRYAKELDPVMVAKIKELRKTDEAAATAMQNTISYHVDHGNGMDCYKVGPTLGAGGIALMDGGDIVYPYCYEKYKIIDHGPLRLTVQFTYTPLTVDTNDNVIETRTLTVDAGTHYNKTTVSYANLSRTTPIVSGLVMAGEKSKKASLSKEFGYATYEDLDRDPEMGAIYVGTIFPGKIRTAAVMPFVKEDPLQKQLGMTGHAVVIGEYAPNSDFTYYWGAAWEKYKITNFEDWVSYTKDKTLIIRNPLTVSLAVK